MLGQLAYLASKILGVEGVERNWMKVKAVKSGQWVNMTMAKTTKQALVHSQYQWQAHAQATKIDHATAGKLWDDCNLASMKVDLYCRGINEPLQVVDEHL